MGPRHHPVTVGRRPQPAAGAASPGQQGEERRPAARPLPQVVEVAALRQGEGDEAVPQLGPEAVGGGPPGGIGVERAVDGAGAGEEPQAVGRERGAAGAAGREAPADGGEVVEGPLAQEGLGLPGEAGDAGGEGGEEAFHAARFLGKGGAEP